MAPLHPDIVIRIDGSGPNGNVFSIISIVYRHLIDAGYPTEALEMRTRALHIMNEDIGYDNLIRFLRRFVDLIVD